MNKNEEPKKDENLEVKELKEKLSKLETKVISQEHRLGASILNFLRFGVRGKDLEKKAASIKSLLYILFISQGAAVVLALGSSIVAIASLWIAFKANRIMQQQNKQFEVQNEIFKTQVNLDEANRRSSLVFLMGNIIDQMDREITEQKKDPSHIDSLGYSLSDALIGRIAALSQGFLPYRYLVGDSLIKEAVSPERGQLLLSLLRSKLDSKTYSKIYEAANFQDADLGEADLRQANLKGAHLYNANLKSAFLQDADLSGAYLVAADLSIAYFIGANLDGVDMEGANLTWTDFSFSNLENVQNFSIDQLKRARTLYQTKNLDPKIEAQLKKEKPCLFEFQFGPNACEDEF